MDTRQARLYREYRELDLRAENINMRLRDGDYPDIPGYPGFLINRLRIMYEHMKLLEEQAKLEGLEYE